jgi:hypothetical protein
MAELVHVVATTTHQIRINLTIDGVVALIAGVLILLVPKLLRFIVGGYLIFVGLIHVFNLHF